MPADMVDQIEDILAAMDVATKPDDLDRPSYRLHPLKGDRLGEWSITVRRNWRLVFEFDGADIRNVDFVDYH